MSESAGWNLPWLAAATDNGNSREGETELSPLSKTDDDNVETELSPLSETDDDNGDYPGGR